MPLAINPVDFFQIEERLIPEIHKPQKPPQWGNTPFIPYFWWHRGKHLCPLLLRRHSSFTSNSTVLDRQVPLFFLYFLSISPVKWQDWSYSNSTGTPAEHQRTPSRPKLRAGALVEWSVLVRSPLDAAKEKPASCSHEDLNVFIVNKPPLSSFIDLHGLAKVEGVLFAGFLE